MAEDKSTDELDEEIKQLEEELASMEDEEDLEEEEPSESPSLKERVPFLGGKKDDPNEAAEAQDSEAEPEADKDEGGPVNRLLGRIRGSEEEEATEEEPAEQELTEEETETAEEAQPPEQPPKAEEDAQATEAPAPAGALGEEPPGPEDEPEPRAGPPEEQLSAQQKRESPRWEKTEDGWRRREADEIPEEEETPATAQERPTEEEAEESPEPKALLARFRGGEPEGEPEEAPPEDEDDDDGGILILAAWILLALLGIAALVAGAVWLLGGTGEDVTANLQSDALEEDGVLIASTGTPIAFDASGSTGPVESYEWDFGDGETTTTQEPTATHTYQERGTYTVTISVNGDGSSDEATRDVRVVDAPQASISILLDGDPVADPGTVGNNPFIGDSLTLDGTASTADEEQEITTYEWDVTGDENPDESGEETSTSLDEAGAWEITLTVTDDLGNTASESAVVHVSDLIVFDETMPPPAAEDVQPQSQLHNTTVNLARQGAGPTELRGNLTYGGEDVELESDLDLSVTSPADTTYEAEDDAAGGQETLTVSSSEIDALGEWTWEVTRDSGDGVLGSASEVDYTLTVEILY